MLSNVSLYYLNQIGITPWVNKPKLSPIIESKLAVLVPDNLSSKAKSLLKQLLSCLSLQEKDLLILRGQKHNDFTQQRPLAVLSFDTRINAVEPLDCPFFANQELEQLLTNPKAKKQVFENLMQINKLIAP